MLRSVLILCEITISNPNYLTSCVKVSADNVVPNNVTEGFKSNLACNINIRTKVIKSELVIESSFLWLPMEHFIWSEIE